MVCSGRTARWWSTLTGSSRMLIWACSLLTAASGCRATLGSGGLDPARIAPTGSSANDHEVQKIHQHTHTIITKQTYIDFIYSHINSCLFCHAVFNLNCCLFNPVSSHTVSWLFNSDSFNLNCCLFNFVSSHINYYLIYPIHSRLNSCLFKPANSHLNYSSFLM